MAHSSQSDNNTAYQPLHLLPSSPEIDLTSSSSHRHADFRAADGRYEPLRGEDQDIADASNGNKRSHTRGLGLQHTRHQSSLNIKRVPVGLTKDSTGDTTTSSHFNVQEGPEFLFSQATTAHNTPDNHHDDQFTRWPSPNTSQPSLVNQERPYRSIPSDVDLLHAHHHVEHGCPTSGDVLRTHWSWYCYAIIFLALFSTLFSGIFLGIALRKPRWNGLKRMPIETATLLSALFSKLIELSFACVFVATLGQILSRKAFARRSAGQPGGVSIAEINMRLWILQPGTLLTHWTGAWFALKTMLGVVVLVAAFAAALYITAAEALVSPKLSFGKNQTQALVGHFSTAYANPRYLNAQCETPITKATVDDEEGPSCMQIKHAGQGYRNFVTWLANWDTKIHSATELNPPDWRPPPVAMMFDNTTVQGQWIFTNKDDISKDSEYYGRMVHNVTLAMPHANVVHAVRDVRNHILQPEDLKGDGEYYVQAAVPAPILNVLCVGLSDDDIAPMILNASTGLPNRFPFQTNVDDIFGFTQNQTLQAGDVAPLFPKIPMKANTILNKTSLYGQKAVYLLSASPPNTDTANFTLCALQSSLYPNCTTSYHVAQSGSQLTVHCSYDGFVDPENSLPYSKFNPETPTGAWSKDWPEIGRTWATAVALSQGISDANASIARTLTWMTPKYIPGTVTELDLKFPTLSEGYGQLAASTLLISADNSPFAHFWNYTGRDHFDIPQDQYFASLVSYKDYTSGNNAPWQGLFYLVLFAIFLLNLFCLCYLLWKFYTDGEVTDYTEPQNLFALAINSPPSNMMSGSCGGGPNGDMLRKKWVVDITMSSPKHGQSPPRDTGLQPPSDLTVVRSDTGSHPHFFVHCSEDGPNHVHAQYHAYEDSDIRQRHVSFDADKSGIPLYQMGSPHIVDTPNSWSRYRLTPSSWSPGRLFRKKSSKQKRPKSVTEVHPSQRHGEASPAFEQYKRLTGQ